MTKATRRETGELRLSVNWVLSRRGWFKVFPDRIECGDWSIPFSDIEEPILYHSRQAFVPVSVLKIRAGAETYQFGFNPWANPERHLPIPYRQERVSLKMSLSSLLVTGLLHFRVGPSVS
jgi:hypothetical protein